MNNGGERFEEVVVASPEDAMGSQHLMIQVTGTENQETIGGDGSWGCRNKVVIPENR